MIVNQARLLAYLLDQMERSASRLTPHYGLHASDLSIDTSGDAEYPVTVTVQRVRVGEHDRETSTIRAKYVVGSDGARSAIRTAIGRELVGDAMNVSWGVMDVLCDTDFPDIRLKCTIQSADSGTIVLIPREGGYLARFYVELDGDRERDLLESGESRRTRLPRSRTGSFTRIRWRFATLDGRRFTRSANACVTSSTTSLRRRWTRGSPGFSSPATRATPTAPKPGRA